MTARDGLLTTKEAAEFLGMKAQTLMLWRVYHKGPPYVKMTDSPAGAVRYRLSDLNDWISARSVAPGAQAVQE